jgi:glycine dehydrogenase subunit 1
MHMAWLGPDRLVNLAKSAVTDARDLAQRLDDISGIQAPVYGRHHFREFVAHTDQPAPAIVEDLEDRGFAVHLLDDHHVQVCVTDVNAHSADELVAAFEEVA